MKKTCWAGLVALFCLLAVLPAHADMRGYVKGQGYEYVQLGEYPYEADGAVKPVLWRILDVGQDEVLLLTEYVIEVKQIIFETDQKVIEAHSFRRINSYAESDLYEWVNTEGLDTLLGDDPIREALIEKEGLGKIAPLTFEQYLNADDYGFNKGQWGEAVNAYPERQAVCTPYARANGLYVDSQNGKSAYWCVAIKDVTGYKFGLVGNNGHISWGAYTNKKVGGLRLAVYLDRSKIAVSGGEGTKDIPYTLTYTGAPAEEVQAQNALFIAEQTPTQAPVQAETAPAQQTQERKIVVLNSKSPEAEATLPPENEPAEVETVQENLEASPLETMAPEAAQIAEAEERKQDVTLSFVGDCSIGDSIQYKGSTTSYHACIDKNGYEWPFSLVKEYLESDDLTVANLEMVFTTRTRHSDKMFNLVGDPDHVQALVAGSVEMVNTVNNHCMDFENAGYNDTLATLEDAGIQHFGTVYAGRPEGHDDLGIADVGGIRFGFVGYSYPQDWDAPNIIKRVQQLKTQEGCDIVIVSLHWGRETYMTPESWQYSYARQLIDGGADMIWGHHPHVVQPIVIYQNKPIMFSTGNFTFGTISDLDPSTGIFQATYERVDGKAQLKQFQVIPCFTQRSPDFRPYVLTEQADRESVFKKLVLKKENSYMQNPPASFLETGIIQFENGVMVP